MTTGLVVGLALAACGCLAGPQPEPPTLGPDSGTGGVADGGGADSGAAHPDASLDASARPDAGLGADAGVFDAGVVPGPLVPPRIPPHVDPLPPGPLWLVSPPE